MKRALRLRPLVEIVISLGAIILNVIWMRAHPKPSIAQTAVVVFGTVASMLWLVCALFNLLTERPRPHQ